MLLNIKLRNELIILDKLNLSIDKINLSIDKNKLSSQLDFCTRNISEKNFKIFNNNFLLTGI